MKTNNKLEQGFTILELLIATTVFSIILLLVTTVLIGISNILDKGVNQARVQDGVTNIVNDMSQELSLSSSKPVFGQDTTTTAYPINVMCIGNIRYSYVLNVQMGHQVYQMTPAPGSPHFYDILWRDVPSGGCLPTQAANLTDANLEQDDATAGNGVGNELVPPNSRLLTMCIGTINVTGACTPTTTDPFTISVEIAYGSDSSICDNSAGDCSSPYPIGQVSPHMQAILESTTASGAPLGGIICKLETGDTYCATAYQSLSVSNRLY